MPFRPICNSCHPGAPPNPFERQRFIGWAKWEFTLFRSTSCYQSQYNTDNFFFADNNNCKYNLTNYFYARYTVHEVLTK